MADLTTQNGNGFDDSCGSSSSFASSSSSSLLKAAQICWENTLEEEKKQHGQPLDVLTAAAHKKNSEYVQQESMLSVVTGEGSENTIARSRTRSLKLENSNVISGCQRRNYQGRKDCSQSFPFSLSIFFTAVILMVCVMSEVVSGSFNDELELEKSTSFDNVVVNADGVVEIVETNTNFIEHSQESDVFANFVRTTKETYFCCCCLFHKQSKYFSNISYHFHSFNLFLL